MVKMNDALLTAIETATRDAIVDTAKEVLKASKPLVPVEDGKLKRSGRVEVDFLEVRVKYKAPHAWLQHENLDYQHPQGGQAKYLEAAAEQIGIAASVTAGVKLRLKR